MNLCHFWTDDSNYSQHKQFPSSPIHSSVSSSPQLSGSVCGRSLLCGPWAAAAGELLCCSLALESVEQTSPNLRIVNTVQTLSPSPSQFPGCFFSASRFFSEGIIKRKVSGSETFYVYCSAPRRQNSFTSMKRWVLLLHREPGSRW